jgi:hypothetical protein
MEAFTQALRDWQVFFSTVSLSSVTLAGLLFVSLSIRQERRKEKGYGDFIRLARGSFGDFLYVLMLGLVFLVPHPVPYSLAVALFALGLARFFGLVRQALPSLRSKNRKTSLVNAIREIALPSLASLGLVIVGVEILRNDMLAVYGLVIVVAALLASASWNAWLILVGDA